MNESAPEPEHEAEGPPPGSSPAWPFAASRNRPPRLRCTVASRSSGFVYALLAYAAYAGYFQLLRATPRAVKEVTDLSGYVHQLADALVPSRPARKA